MGRKEDARRKIQLGGLVIKAGLDSEQHAVILGVLIEAARALRGQNGQALRARFERAGDLVFSGGERHGDEQQ